MVARYPTRLQALGLLAALLAQGFVSGPALASLGAKRHVEASQAIALKSIPVLAVTASSTDGMLMDAVDGDLTTAWRNLKAGEPSAWLAVRFESQAPCRAVRLDTGPLAAGVVFDVDTSLDGEHYQAALKAQRIDHDTYAAFGFTPREALYLRVTFRYLGAGAAPRFSIRELDAQEAL